MIELDPGNVESYLPDVLQPVPFEQVTARRSGSGWHYTLLEARNRDQLTAEAICFAYIM